MNEEQLKKAIGASEIPAHLRDGLVRYFLHHIRPGAFLMSALEGRSWQEVVSRADDGGVKLFALLEFLRTHAPQHAWGTPLSVQDWLMSRSEL